MSKSAPGNPMRHRPRPGHANDTRRFGRTAIARATGAVFLATAVVSFSQNALDVNLHPSGMVEISRAKTCLATIDLNAHGTGWAYGSQKDVEAKVSDLPGRARKRFEGTFTIPNTEDGAIRFTEDVSMLPRGFRLEYDLTTTKAMKLNGLQVSISLPVERFAGKEMLVSQLGKDPTLVGLPKEHREGNSQVWSGEGARIELAKDTDEAIVIELRAVTDVLVQDLRQWESPLFEVRFPAILEHSGREISAGTRFHLDITVTLAAPVRLVGN